MSNDKPSKKQTENLAAAIRLIGEVLIEDEGAGLEVTFEYDGRKFILRAKEITDAHS